MIEIVIVFMLHFQLPSSNPLLYKQICANYCENNTELPMISSSLSYYLTDIKERIDNQEQEWDIYKRFTNPYEYIHTNIPDKKRCVSKYKPLSRSYFKMIEITQYFRLLDTFNNDNTKPFRSFHLAEGPGGFIEALCHLRNNNKDLYVGMTMLHDNKDPNIPGWKKSQQFLKDYNSVQIENGKDATGNILSIDNFDYCYEKYKGSMNIITGDGGFDFSVDFNSQEQHISQLLFGQIVYALVMQKYKGCFVLKIFDSFMYHTIDLLALLTSCYEKVYITKPQTSRYANSEKYIVCKNFVHKSTENLYNYLRVTFNHMLTNTDKIIYRYLNRPVSSMFLCKIEECNAIFGQQQIECIYNTLNMIIERGNGSIDEKKGRLLKINVQKCIAWCSKYNVSSNTIFL
jgi:23S rRNA U2552 (ribose-2'-O)-methylase RlmE/FtsJ